MVFLKDPLKLVTFEISNLDEKWEEITNALAKEKGLTQSGLDLKTKKITYAYHPHYFTAKKLAEKIKKLGGKITRMSPVA